MKAILLFLILFLFFTRQADAQTVQHASLRSGKLVPSTVNKTVLLELVNQVRQKGCQCGDTYYNPAPPVSWNSQLESAAYTHSLDMFQNNYFSHTAPDGSNAGVRIQNEGYHWMAYGENIAAGYKTEREVMAGWIKSPGHCRNLMNKSYKEMGVARAGNYWTQVFAKK